MGAGAAAFRAGYQEWVPGTGRAGLARRVDDALTQLGEDLVG